MEMEGLDEVYKFQRFQPTDQEAVTYFLPRLLAGSPLPHGADTLIHHADVYACEPKGLAEKFAPVPTAVTTGDRFFFTTCKRKNGRCARVAGAGSWTINKTANVCRAGVKVGEVKHLSFKKDKLSTGWVMEEYRCLLPEALVADGDMVLCRIHLKQNPPAAAREESDAYKLRQERAEEPPVPVTVTASAHAQKRPAPVAAAADQSSWKKTRTAAPVPTPDEEEYEDCPVWFTPTAPVPLPAASTEVPHVQWRPAPVAAHVPAPEEEYEDCPVWSTEEADDDNGRLSCTMEELLGVQQEDQTLPVEAENNTDQLVFDQGIDLLELDIDELAASVDLEWLDLQTLLADDCEEEAGPEKSCSYNATAADLHAPSPDGRNQFFSSAAVS